VTPADHATVPFIDRVDSTLTKEQNMPVLPPTTNPPDENPGPQDRGAPPPEPTPDPPAVSDETQWRSRALKAEEDARRLEGELAEIKATLDAAKQQLGQTERRSAIQRELQAAGAIDLDATMLLVEQALATGNPGDVPGAVNQIRAQKPVLFTAAPSAPALRHSSMSGAVDPQDRVGLLAAQARQTGDRRLLLSYLRARRGR
jgi:hypothetical protein